MLTKLALSEKIRRQIYEWEDFIFEKRNSLELGEVWHADLMSENEESLRHATACQAVWCRNLREIFKEVRKTGIVLQNFIDIGSGKGKACFYAYKKMHFEKIIGIDFSSQLVQVATENSRRLRSGNIVFIHADANEFCLPDANNLIFLFNPFDQVILEKFIANNLSHFVHSQSLIAYANDIHRETLIDAGFTTIFRNETRKISLFGFN